MRALLALLLLMPLRTASAGNNEVWFGSHVRALRSGSANALTEDSLTGGGFGYARLLDVSIVDRLSLWATGSFVGASATGTMFQTLDTSIDTMQLTGGARGHYEVFGWLDATARLDLGMARASVEMSDTAGHSASDHGWGVTAQGALGLEVIGRRRSHRGAAIGLRLELGYALTSPLSLVATPNRSSDGTLTLPMQAAALGSLDLSGPTFGATVATQF